MICYFPAIYPDELLYSQLARYYSKSGYMAYTFAAQDLFVSKTVRPDIEFLNTFTEDAFKVITRNQGINDIVKKHTMFPYYGRFLNINRRKKAFTALVNINGNYHNLLAIPKTKTSENRYLRYCPLCANDDRKQYGETYWHRIHQMIGINICPVHFCNLINSDVIISGKTSPSLITAEESCIKTNVIKSDNKIECKLANYVKNVFLSDVNLSTEVLTGDFLHSKMEGTKYRSARGEQRNISLFYNDFANYYKSLPNSRITELFQIQKILTNDKFNMVEICMIAMFINISTYDLTNMILPEKTQEQKFDEQIFLLHEQGLNYVEIADRLKCAYSTVKSIGEKSYGTYHKKPKKPLKSGVKAKNWVKLDNDTLPEVIKVIQKMLDDSVRPKKITVFAIEKALNLPQKQLNNMPKCKSEIQKHYESHEEYWARETEWAVKKIIIEGLPMNWKHIRNLTNMRKSNLISCIEYIKDIDIIIQAKKMLSE